MKTKGIYLLYRSLQAFGLPLLLLYFLFREFRNPAYVLSIRQRCGFLPRSFKQTTPGAIWLHAVSVGEILSSIELLRQLQTEFPRSPVFVSTTTLAGRTMADQKLAGLAAGVFYAPIDYVFAVRRVLRCLQPSVVVIAETEIWPNLFREVKRIGAGLLMINGRISDRALPRYLRLRWFFRQFLGWPDRILAQTHDLRERFIRIGASPEKIQVGGNLKYDFQPREAEPGSPVRLFLNRVQPREVWIAASTMPPAESQDPDEDDAVINAFQELAVRHSGMLLLLAPRRPQRFELVSQKLRQAGVRFVRRSLLQDHDWLPLPAVLLLDSVGELSGLFALADVVFMGGTLASRGGHNILEPAFFERPVVIGPHMENFRAIAGEFRVAGACVEIRQASELANAVHALLEDPGGAADIGRRALACAAAERGAVRRAVEEIQRLSQHHFPSYRPPWPQLPILWSLALLWVRAGHWKRERDRSRSRRLEAPVISIGNITMGGTGKTPFVLYLAERMRIAGRKPAILTRGYGRYSPEKHLALAPGARLPVDQSGDEPQIFLRSAVAPVGIGPDRFVAGRLLESQFAVDTFILDDGFQHLRLERQIDIVVIDALNPFGGCRVFPMGRLREPLEGLGRADIFLISRSDYGRTVEAVERRLRRYNANAPIFHTRVEPAAWVEHLTGDSLELAELQTSRVAAFCGLGNPQSFWCTLTSLGIKPVDRLEFDDHHRYRPRELRYIAEQFRIAGAEAIVTTEKDMLNLSEDCDALIAPLKLYWLRIRLEIERQDEFWRLLDRQLAQVG